MRLPQELLAVLFLIREAYAFPQNELQANVGTPSTESSTPVEPTFPPSEELQQPWEDPCWASSCVPVNLLPELPTESGWEDDNSNMILEPSDLTPPEQPPIIVTTRIPIIVSIQTDIASTTRESPTRAKPTGNSQLADGPKNAEDINQPNVPAQPQRPGPHVDDTPDEPVPAAHQTEDNGLMLEVISRMGNSPTNAQFTQTTPPSSINDEWEHIPAQPQASSSEENAASLQPASPEGAEIVLGSATLALTPGLSTTIGAGTFIGINTDEAGRTIITLASSGTAITATVTDAPVTMTLPETGFEGSITAAALPGTWSAPGATGTAASSSSKAGAACTRVELDWWTGALPGLVGLGMIL